MVEMGKKHWEAEKKKRKRKRLEKHTEWHPKKRKDSVTPIDEWQGKKKNYHGEPD